MDCELLLIGNDQTVTVTGVQDDITKEYITDATVTATIKNRDGSDVAGESWPITLDYITDWQDEGFETDGNYRGNFEDGIELVDEKLYTVEIGIDGGADLIALFHFERRARWRTPA